MPQHISLDIELPDDLSRFRLPEAVNQPLQALLDRQDSGETLSTQDRSEAEGLTNLAELLTLLRLRSERVNGK